MIPRLSFNSDWGFEMSSKLLHEMSPRELASRIRKFPEAAPISDEFEAELKKIGMSDIDRRWYTTQKEHWLGWLSEYDGPGYYGRQSSDGKDAKYVYNHIMNPAMLLWFCEASGAPADKVKAAKDAALSAKRTYPSQSAAIRRLVKWEDVATCLNSTPHK